MNSKNMVRVLKYIQAYHRSSVVNFKMDCGLPVYINSISQALTFLNHHRPELASLAWKAR